jgi:hypothetical protein
VGAIFGRVLRFEFTSGMELYGEKFFVSHNPYFVNEDMMMYQNLWLHEAYS